VVLIQPSVITMSVDNTDLSERTEAVDRSGLKMKDQQSLGDSAEVDDKVRELLK